MRDRCRSIKKICFHGIIASEGFVLPDPAGGFRIGPAAADTHLSGSPTLEIKLVILKSIDGDPGARGAFVQVQPSPLDVAAHHVNLPVRCIAIASAKLVKRGNEAVGFLILTFPLRENLLTGCIFEVIDVGLVDIELQQ